MVNLILSKSVKSAPDGPLRVWQDENSLSAVQVAIFSTVTSKKAHQQGQFVNGHVFEHPLAIAFKAFPETFGCIFVRIVGDKGDVSTVGGLVFTGLAYEFANIFVVPHEYRDALLGFGVIAHIGQFLDGGGAGFFQVNDRTTRRIHGLFEEGRIIGRTTRNERQTLDALGDGWQIGQTGKKLHPVRGLGFFGKLGKFRSTGSTGTRTQEPGFDNVRQRGAGNVSSQHLFGMIPSHATIGGTTTHQYNLCLTWFDFDGHL
mmetsp:Transcript_2809/g.5475  ORF Transcript_2809/g.5475 Transcript_2809/m.5475 type:complete len:259 (-) Transcript_2809:129-905(-)